MDVLLSLNYYNMLTLLAHILGQKQVWIGDDGEERLAVVYGCTHWMPTPPLKQPARPEDMGKQLARGSPE